MKWRKYSTLALVVVGENDNRCMHRALSASSGAGVLSEQGLGWMLASIARGRGGSLFDWGVRMPSIRTSQRRSRQLDTIVAVLVIALLVVLGLLIFFVTQSGVALPTANPLSEYVTRTLLAGMVLLLLLYIVDQRRRLEAQVAKAMQEAEDANVQLAETVRWLTFSHEAASTLAVEGLALGLNHVLAGAAELHQADAAGVMGEDLDYSFVADESMADDADRAMMHVALVCAGRDKPMLLESLGPSDGHALAVPLRVHGELRFVLCLWNKEQEFQPRQLESLGLMGRMVELAIEREESMTESQSQLEGTLNVLQYLVSDKRPDYADHAMRVAGLASELGRQMGLKASERRDLRFAGLLHDVGIMTLDQDFSDASKPLTHEERLVVQQHPRISSEIAAVAQFDTTVQEAIAGHHERWDGTGYPGGLRGEAIPQTARILAVCEVYDSMTNRTYHGEAASINDALSELRNNAGALYDARVVAAMLQLFPQGV